MIHERQPIVDAARHPRKVRPVAGFGVRATAIEG